MHIPVSYTHLYLTENADQFGVQRENYALMGFSSGGHIVGLIGSDNEKFGYKEMCIRDSP